MSTLLEEETLTTDSPPEDVRHYYPKSELDENLLNGKNPKALCGHIREGLAHPAETMDHLPICSKCQEIWEAME